MTDWELMVAAENTYEKIFEYLDNYYSRYAQKHLYHTYHPYKPIPNCSRCGKLYSYKISDKCNGLDK